MANGAWTWYGLDGPDGAHHVIVIATWPQPDRRLEMVACLDTGSDDITDGRFPLTEWPPTKETMWRLIRVLREKSAPDQGWWPTGIIRP